MKVIQRLVGYDCVKRKLILELPSQDYKTGRKPTLGSPCDLVMYYICCLYKTVAMAYFFLEL